MNLKAIQIYREAVLEGQSTAGFLTSVYEAMLRYLNDIVESKTANPQTDSFVAMQRVQALLTFLQSSLTEPDRSTVSTQLGALYIYVRRRIEESVQHDDIHGLFDAISVVKGLLEAWQSQDVVSEQPESERMQRLRGVS